MIQSRHTRNKTTDIPTRIPATPAGTLLKNNNKKNIYQEIDFYEE